MRWLLPVCAIIALTLAGPVRAGAWLKAKNSGFFSVTGTLRGPLEMQMFGSETAIYGEYGLLDNLTIGIDLNYRDIGAGHALAFARLPIGRTDRNWRLAAELGFGRHLWLEEWAQMVKTGLSVGRGLQTKRGGGWVNVDAAAEWREGLAEPLYKLDGIIGITLWPRFDALFKVETAYLPETEDFGWALTPGIAWRQNDNTRLVAGIEFRDAAGLRTTGVTLSLWRDF